MSSPADPTEPPKIYECQQQPGETREAFERRMIDEGVFDEFDLLYQKTFRPNDDPSADQA